MTFATHDRVISLYPQAMLGLRLNFVSSDHRPATLNTLSASHVWNDCVLPLSQVIFHTPMYLSSLGRLSLLALSHCISYSPWTIKLYLMIWNPYLISLSCLPLCPSCWSLSKRNIHTPWVVLMTKSLLPILGPTWVLKDTFTSIAMDVKILPSDSDFNLPLIDVSEASFVCWYGYDFP